MSSTPPSPPLAVTIISRPGTPAPTLHEEPVNVPSKEDDPNFKVKEVDDDNSNVLIVDWEGPDDPENPKK